MSNYQARFLVEPQAKIKLKKLDPASHGKHESAETALLALQKNVATMDQLQYLMYAGRKHSLLIVLQGLDSAGKDGVIRHVLSSMNPQGCTVTGFKAPTPEELAHDFLWRVHPHAPGKGSVAIFNRSHYEDVLVTRVHEHEPRATWAARYDRINDFEKLLVEQNNTTILKFFLHISKDEQLARFKKRLDDPMRNWKISEADYLEREYWDAYTEAYEDLLSNTSTEHAPWFIIPSDHKWFRDLAISQIIARSLEALEMRPPTTAIDLGEIRRKYLETALEAKVEKRRARG